MALSPQDREAFLAEPHIGVLSVTRADPDRGPLSVPIWYDYEPGGDLWVLTGADSAKARAIQAAGRFTLVAEEVQPSVKYVSAEGPVLSVTDATDEEHRAMVVRYLPADKVEGYLKAAEAYGPQVKITIHPDHWLSADMGTL
ncbi:pyridoxamine 5'-phosphate oxidase family protein [Streptomyces sp. NPDC060194]|uniref:pyridoxamine 5'-phosphate oxidase family protein n=1 Tax=Streptomyces sp. NPDC060194 TaxID=3347069 RepID=UPI00365865C4